MKIDPKYLIGALAIAGVALAAVSGVTGSPDAPDAPAAPTAPAGADGAPGQLPPDHPPIDGSDAAPAGAFRATVEQVIPASRYLYLEVEYEEGGATGAPTWLAGPAMEIEEGDVVAWTGGTLMRDFSSSTLDRTFDEILFVGRLEVVGGG